jgi:hypothetical protein
MIVLLMEEKSFVFQLVNFEALLAGTVVENFV